MMNEFQNTIIGKINTLAKLYIHAVSHTNYIASAAFGSVCFAMHAEVCLRQASARAVLEMQCVTLYGQC